MARLLDSADVEVSVDYRTFGIVDEACRQDTHTPDAPQGSWVQVARGMAYLQCPSEVIRARLRLESWSTTPPSDQSQWSGREDVEVELPSGVLGVHMLTSGWEAEVLVLPSPGRYGLRLHWALNPETGPFYSPFTAGPALDTPAGHQQRLAGADEFCLAQLWRMSSQVG
ncbi:hypothetical protein ACWGJT_29160 [Streptomyces xantholiticus]